MPGIDYDSAINVHIRHNGVPGRASSYVPGMSAAYENQALIKFHRGVYVNDITSSNQWLMKCVRYPGGGRGYSGNLPVVGVAGKMKSLGYSRGYSVVFGHLIVVGYQKYLPSKYSILVYTKTVDSVEGAR